MGYADKGGLAREFTVEPLTLTAGFLTAFDTASHEVRRTREVLHHDVVLRARAVARTEVSTNDFEQD